MRAAVICLLALTGAAQAQEPTTRELQILIDERQHQINQRFELSEKSVITALGAAEKRLDLLNEFRGQLKDQAGTFITRSEVYAFLSAMIFMLIGMAAIIISLVRRNAGGNPPQKN